ncbi:MAG: cob(I)yrinic acid a,c-diamide adenosyltransferase [Gammaproteobacteria bacterium]|nr:cob(I)yrinic acid a,c-diamide adenosyltransferase [Gammaproteobacteria bacterium]MDH3448459.1 cob(I)yrinic acid a,c-diamide adenosyltransferase [Gammaproteobacteria bacterium]
MGNRLTKVYTRTGDHGTTGLADGSRVAKNDPRVVCMGEVDELNACIGVALSQLDDGPIAQALFAVQHDLFDIGAELCQPGKQLITQDYVEGLEKSADAFNADLGELKEFILPGGSQAVAGLQLARTVCRRVERSLVNLNDAVTINPLTCRYINRLSDLLFILARAQSQLEGGGEVYWNSKYSRINRGK